MTDNQTYYAIRFTTGKNKGKFVLNGGMGCLRAEEDAMEACSHSKEDMTRWFHSLPENEFELVKITITMTVESI